MVGAGGVGTAIARIAVPTIHLSNSVIRVAEPAFMMKPPTSGVGVQS